jgi:hypothetical protein
VDGRRQLSCPACCLKKECYPTDCCRFVFLLLFFRGLPDAERRAPGDFQNFRNSRVGWRISGLSQAAQNQFLYALCLPRLDPALQRSELCLTVVRFWKHRGQPIHQYIGWHRGLCDQPFFD